MFKNSFLNIISAANHSHHYLQQVNNDLTGTFMTNAGSLISYSPNKDLFDLNRDWHTAVM